MKGLTAKQQEILDHIEAFMRREGMAPTVYEIADEFKIRSATAFAHLRALQRKGYVNRSSKARSLSIPGMAKPGQGTGGMTLQIPVIGRVAAGVPLLAEEQVEDHIKFDPSLLPRGLGGHKIFALKVFGESMRDLGILDGDTIVAKQTNQARIGDIIVAAVDNEVTVKSFYIKNGMAELRPANPEFNSVFCPLDKLSVQGVVIALTRTY